MRSPKFPLWVWVCVSLESNVCSWIAGDHLRIFSRLASPRFFHLFCTRPLTPHCNLLVFCSYHLLLSFKCRKILSDEMCLPSSVSQPCQASFLKSTGCYFDTINILNDFIGSRFCFWIRIQWVYFKVNAICRFHGLRDKWPHSYPFSSLSPVDSSSSPSSTNSWTVIKKKTF